MSENTRTEFGGRHYISGNVVLPSGLPPGEKTRIRLAAPAAEVIGYTDEQGKFVFSRLPNGTYTVIFDATDEYDSEEQTVLISGSDRLPPVSEFVTLRLRLKTKAATKPLVVDAAFEGVNKKAREHYKQGLDLSSQKKDTEAIEQFKLAIAEDPRFFLAHSQLGLLYLRQNETNKAEQQLALAIKIKPDAVDPLANRGIALVRLKRFDEAVSTLVSVIALRDDLPGAHYYLGRAYVGLTRLDEAEASFRKALTLQNAPVADIRRALASLYLEKDEFQQAIDELEIYLSLAPTAPDAQKLKETVQQLKEHLRNTAKPQ